MGEHRSKSPGFLLLCYNYLTTLSCVQEESVMMFYSPLLKKYFSDKYCLLQ